LVLTVSSAKWADEDDSEIVDFDGDGNEFFLDAEDKKMLHEDILDDLLAVADQKLLRPPPTCGKESKKERCTMGLGKRSQPNGLLTCGVRGIVHPQHSLLYEPYII